MTGALPTSLRSYRFRAFTPRGDIEEGKVEARSAEEAADLIWDRGLTLMEPPSASQGEAVPWWKRDIAFGSSKKPSERAVSEFTRQCATLAQAEIPLDDALRMIAGEIVSRPMREISASLLADILDGSPFSEALGRHPDVFTRDYVNIVRAGETSGDTARVLVELASLLERRLELSGKVKSALIYPSILVVLALVSVGVIMNVLIPNIAPIFAQNGKPLPTLIAILVSLQANWQALLLGSGLAVAIGGVAAWALLRFAPVRHALDRVILRLPLAGAITTKREAARFSRTLGTLLRAGVPMVAAFAAAREVVANRFLGDGLDKSLHELQDGAALAKSLTRNTALPRAALQMIGIGEEAGKLDHMLLRVADSFERQTQRQIDDLMTLLTPALTVVIAGLIGSLIFTVMNAILSINELAIQ